jgi:hypothetical protein
MEKCKDAISLDKHARGLFSGISALGSSAGQAGMALEEGKMQKAVARSVLLEMRRKHVTPKLGA